MSTHDLNIAQLAIYAILALPVISILVRHGVPGLLGWLYLLAFCSLRIIGAALALKNGPEDQTASIISNIGLSPLILAISGILHEARHYRNPHLEKKMEFILVLLYHILITTGLALLAVSSSASSSNSDTSTSTNKSDVYLMKVGIIILLISWLVLCIWSIFSLVSNQRKTHTATTTSADGTKLLYAVLFALPFTGIRVMYSTAAIFAPSTSLNPTSGVLGLRLGLSFIPELTTVIGFVVVGFVTQRIRGVGGQRVDGNTVIMESSVCVGGEMVEERGRGKDLGSSAV